MKHGHYEFPPSTADDGHGQYFLFNVHHFDENGRLGIQLTQGQIEQIRKNRRRRLQVETQLHSPEAQPSVSRRAGHVAIRQLPARGYSAI